jgi:hypothetical protein
VTLSTKLLFIIEGEIKMFQDKQKLKQFIATKPSLMKILKGILYTEDEHSHETMEINNSHHMSR